MKKILAIVLTLCLLLGMSSIPAFADEQTTLPSWTLGNGTVNGTYASTLHDTEPFNMVQYFTGQNAAWTANGDTPGVYEDLTVSTTNALRYNCHMKSTTADPNNWAQGYTGIAGGGTENFYFFPRVALAIGVTFTSPVSGTVTFKYHLAKLIDSDSDTTLYMGVGNPGTMPENVWKDTDFSSYGAKKLASASTLATAQEYTVDVEKGDVVYFLFASFDDSNPSRAAFYFEQVAYSSVKTETETATATVLGYGLSANDNVDMRFIVKLSTAAENCTASATVGGKAVDVTYAPYLGSKPNSTTEKYTESDYVYTYVVRVTATQMTEDVVLSVKNGDTELLTSNNSYTVEGYCNAQIAVAKAAGATDAEKNVGNVCASMLLYGYMAQVNFASESKKPELDMDYINRNVIGSLAQ